MANSLYRQHLYAARHLAELAHRIEEHQNGEPDQDVILRHRTYVVGAILAAAAFLETSINELHLEMQDPGAISRSTQARRQGRVPRPLWPAQAPPPTLHRYQLTLVVADAEPFDERRAPFRDADALLALRDSLLHGRPEWRDARGMRGGRLQDLERHLLARFRENALATPADPAFPDRLLGTACAFWAVRVAERFSNDFCRRLTIPARGLA